MSSTSSATSTSELELRAVVKFCVGLKLTPVETLNQIKNSHTLQPCGKSFVYKWHERFRNGRKSVLDDDRAGRPASAMTTSNATLVRELLDNDRRLTVRGIAEELSLSYSTVQRILTEELNMSKVSARWVPRLLTDENKQRRLECSQQFLDLYDAQGDEFLDKIITTDETWLYHYDPESKQQSSIWKSPDTPPPKKARTTRSCKKEMFIFFMDRQGLLLQHKVRDGCTVNADYYSKVCRILVIQTINTYKLFL